MAKIVFELIFSCNGVFATTYNRDGKPIGCAAVCLPDGSVPKFVVRAIQELGNCVKGAYGVGHTEEEARLDAEIKLAVI